jgi:hypothetical protein
LSFISIIRSFSKMTKGKVGSSTVSHREFVEVVLESTLPKSWR